jgi:hypothetical protein
MKNYCFLLLLFGTLSVQAQKNKGDASAAPAKKNYLELGVNVSGAVQAFVRNNTDSIVSDPYALSLKFVTHKFGIRLGAGYSLKSSKYITLLQARVEELARLDLRAGFDYQRPINEHWRIYYGADVLFGTVKGGDQYSEGKDVIKVDIDEKMFGAGPILGIQYHVNRHISFQTEAAFYYMQINSNKKYTYVSKPDLTKEEPTTTYLFPPGIPRSLSVIIRF